MTRGRLAWALILALGVGLVVVWLAWPQLRGPLRALEREAPVSAPAAPPDLEQVAALGRIEPRGGVHRVAGPPRPSVVIQDLLVEEGETVREGQVLALLAGRDVQAAEVERLQAELANAQRELKRNQQLRRGQALSESELEGRLLAQKVAEAALARARAELALSTVRAPIDGRVLEIHARRGERVGADGILELADTDVMLAVAEVYETDVGRVRLGQPAVVRSRALPRPLAGKVERIGLKVDKKDVLSTDPVADADARVVEVEIRLEEPERVAALTNLRVEVLIGP